MIIFIVSKVNPSMASFRYRALWMAQSLSISPDFRGKLLITDQPDRIDQGDLTQTQLVVFVKAFNSQCTKLAWSLHERKVPIAIDLCDNIFLDEYLGGFKGYQTRNEFYSIASLSNIIITPTQKLSDLCKEKLNRFNSTQYYIIPDGFETRSNLEEFIHCLPKRDFQSIQLTTNRAYTKNNEEAKKHSKKKKPLDGRLNKIKKHLILLKKDPANWYYKARSRIKQNTITYLKANPNIASARKKISTKEKIIPSKQPKLLWFGNAGGEHGSYGIQALAKILPELNIASDCIKFELEVVSNNKKLFDRFIRKDTRFPCYYKEWDLMGIYKKISEADACLIPNTNCSFSKTKSSNRAVLSLSLGTPVIADDFPDLNWLKQKRLVYVNEWQAAIHSILIENKSTPSDFSELEITKKLNSYYSLSANRYRWETLISDMASKDIRNKKFVTIVLDLIQDLDVVKNIICSLSSNSEYYLEIIVSRWLEIKSPRVTEYLKKKGCNFLTIDREKLLSDEHLEKVLYNSNTVIFPSETNLNPHRVAHHMARFSNKKGIKTITLQHGLENVGLTYFDGLKVEFASSSILTWGNFDHPMRLKATQNKIKPVGIFREFSNNVNREELEARLGYKKIIGVFENLHWDRYNENYREFVIQCINGVASEFSDVCFLVKPHHAGMWIKKQGIEFDFKNIIVCDLLDPYWERWTGAELVSTCDLILTTPSTISIDAALIDKPVAVFANGLEDLEIYESLTRLDNSNQLRNFVSSLNDDQRLLTEKKKAKKFLDEHISDVNNFDRLLNTI